jgi:hypothetical protein
MEVTSNYRSIEDVESNAALYEEKEVPHHLQDKSQRWCLATLVAKEGTSQKYKNGMAIRVYGCKATKPAANKWARRLPAATGNFDICTVLTHEWIALPPRLEGGEERCNEERVDEIMLQFKKQEMGKKQVLTDRLNKEKRVPHPLKPLPDGKTLETVEAAEEEKEKEEKRKEEEAEALADSEESAEADDVSVPDHLRDREQAWCVMSVVAPDCPEGAMEEMAIRIHGCRATPEEAEEWERQLHESNPYFHVFTLKCNEFARLPPDMGKIQKFHSNEKVVQHLHDSHTAENMARRKDEAAQLKQAHERQSAVPALVIQWISKEHPIKSLTH